MWADAWRWLAAFEHDFAVNGPSMVRMIRTTLAGWKRYKAAPDPRIRRQFQRQGEELATTYMAVVAATKRYYRNNPALYAVMSGLLDELVHELGWRSRVFAAVGGPYVAWKIRQEEKRLADGPTNRRRSTKSTTSLRRRIGPWQCDAAT